MESRHRSLKPLSKSMAPMKAKMPKKKDQGDLERLPGPEGLPILGNALSVTGTDFHRVLIKWGEQYGTVFKISVLGQISVVVSDLNHLDQLLATTHEEAPNDLPLDLATGNESSMTYTRSANHKTHNNIDSPINASFAHDDTLPNIFPHFKEEMMVVVEQLRRLAASETCSSSGSGEMGEGKGGVLVDIGDVCIRMINHHHAFNSSHPTSVNIRHGPADNHNQESPIIEALMRARVMETNRAEQPFPKCKTNLPFLNANHQHASHLSLISGIGAAEVGERVPGLAWPLQRANTAPVPYTIQNLTDWKTGRGRGEDERSAHTDLLGSAGFLPAALIAAYALYEIHAHAGVETRIEAELSAADLLGKPEKLSCESMDSLNFLCSAVKEAARLHTVVPQLNRVSDRDLILKSFRIPKGTPLFLGIGIVHNSSDNYIHPNKYWPGRWEHTEDEVKEKYGAGAKMGSRATPIGHIDHISASFISLSTGHPQCLPRATMIVAQVMSAFKLRLDETSPDPEGVIREEVYDAMTINPGKPIKLRLSPRV